MRRLRAVRRRTNWRVGGEGLRVVVYQGMGGSGGGRRMEREGGGGVGGLGDGLWGGLGTR